MRCTICTFTQNNFSGEPSSRCFDLLGVLEELLALGDQLTDDGPLGLKLAEGLLLPLDQLLNVLDAAGSDVSGGAEHDAVQELDVRLELVAVCVALPVEVHLDLGLEDGGNELLVLLDEGIELGDLFGPLFLASLSHQDFKDLFQPFLDLATLQVFAKSLEMKVVV